MRFYIIIPVYKRKLRKVDELALEAGGRDGLVLIPKTMLLTPRVRAKGFSKLLKKKKIQDLPVLYQIYNYQIYTKYINSIPEDFEYHEIAFKSFLQPKISESNIPSYSPHYK